MSGFAVTLVTADVTPENFLEAAAAGRVKFHTVRTDGTTRRVQFYADGTKDREVAEWVAEQRDDGVTMKAIAADMHVSVPTVRRILNALVLAETVEAYEPEEVEELLAEATADSEPTEEPVAPEANPEPAVDVQPDSEPVQADTNEEATA